MIDVIRPEPIQRYMTKPMQMKNAAAEPRSKHQNAQARVIQLACRIVVGISIASLMAIAVFH
jgi:hypothetical protein